MVEDVEGRPRLRVSWTTDTETAPCVGLRVVGTDEAGGMNLSSLDCQVSLFIAMGWCTILRSRR